MPEGEVPEARQQLRIVLAGHAFDGPYPSPSSFVDLPGVRAVLISRGPNIWGLLDAGQASSVRTHLLELVRSRTWTRFGEIGFAAYYTDSEIVRAEVEYNLRARYLGAGGNGTGNGDQELDLRG